MHFVATEPSWLVHNIKLVLAGLRSKGRHRQQWLDSTGQTIDFLLTGKRDTAAAKRFFRNALSSPGNPMPRVINLHFSHRFVARRGEGRGYEAREAQRADAYLNSTSSTVSERNEVDAALSRAAAERV